ncbi:hypothetical protein D9757_009770 [Collybiopsis confluens]|uniref:Uncharacterized protein n=1 Tax=Collybiopsis confluens TaxID=2823264 RepID=A0A8H5GYB2_9AGAR|nr:hypothetical protein D9757_009770 [Collybiopsis confluens]
MYAVESLSYVRPNTVIRDIPTTRGIPKAGKLFLCIEPAAVLVIQSTLRSEYQASMVNEQELWQMHFQGEMNRDDEADKPLQPGQRTRVRSVLQDQQAFNYACGLSVPGVGQH